MELSDLKAVSGVLSTITFRNYISKYSPSPITVAPVA